MGIIKSFISKFFNKAESSSSSKSFEKIWNDLGVFKYENDGFEIIDEDFTANIKWTDIHKITAYKKDLFTIDLIVMEIIHDDKVLTINEELPGWFQFVLKTKEIFREIPKGWDLEIMNPAFEENYTLLYDKTLLPN